MASVTVEAIRSGIDLSHVDAGARPQDDLFGHVNGRWLADYAIPADRATDGAFRLLADRAEEQVRDIITEAAAANGAEGTDPQRIGDLYASFMDTDTIAGLGVRPLLDELAGVDAALTPTELAAELGELQRTGIGGGTGLYVDTDSKNSTRYLLHLSQSGLGLPDESYYRDPQHAEILAEYPKHIARMFALVYGEHEGDWDATAAHIVALETKIAAAHWDVVKRRDADLTYNLRTFAELRSEATGFDWPVWLHALGVTGEQAAEVVVRQPDALITFAALWDSEDIEDWRRWLRWRVISGRASLLSDDIVDENFAFYGRTLSGTEQLRDRWKRGVGLVESLMGDAVGRLYVERHFPPDAKARMDELVANLREAYRVSITDLEWMTPETRQRALEKLDKFTPKIGYPAKWRDYSSLVIARDDLYGNYQRGYALEYDRDLAKLGGPVDRDEWFMTPQTVNAYYNPGHERDRLPGSDPAAAVLRRRSRRRGELRRYRRGDRPRDRPRLRRPGCQVRRRRQPGRLVDRRRPRRVRFPHKGSHRAVRGVHPSRPRRRPPRQRRVHRRGEHRRSRWPVHRAARLPAVTEGRGGARHRRPDRGAAGVLRLGSGVAHEIP